jgi:hypothetical protein
LYLRNIPSISGTSHFHPLHGRSFRPNMQRNTLATLAREILSDLIKKNQSLSADDQ